MGFQTSKLQHLQTKKGFTLIEVLIALAIASIVAVALFSIYLAVMNVLTTLSGRSERIQEARNIIDILSKELASSYIEPEDRRTFFVLKDRDIYGKPASALSFTSFSERGLMKISYEVREEENGKRLRLIKRQGPAFRQEDLEAELLEDIEGFLIEVLGMEKTRTWDSELTRRLPEKVRITLSLKSDGKGMTFSETIGLRLR